MNSRERIQRVIEGKFPDRTPIHPKIAFSNVIATPHIRVTDYMTDPKCMAEACITALKTFGWDGASLHTDIGSEGMALGSIYNRPEDRPTELKKHLLDSLEDYERVVIPDPLKTEPMCTVIEAVGIVRERIGREVHITAWTNGPLNVAGQILPIPELLMGMISDPDTVHRLLDRCTNVAIAYAEALINAGADSIAFGHATASSNMISRSHYEEFALPYEKRLIEGIHRTGAVAITHICGNIEDRVDLIAENGSEIIDFDHVCDFRVLRQRGGANKVFRGNIDPTLLVRASKQEIEDAVKNLMEQVGDDPRFLLGSGCEIALTTPPENLHAFVKSGIKYSHYF